MNILIVNDDSISAPVLLPFVRWAQKLGNVTVLVPKYEQSGKSHSIELHKAFEVKPVELGEGLEAYTVDSSPADCVRYAVLGLKRKFDLVLSGVNNGYNIGRDIMYSGTAAGVFEAAYLGIPAIAISTTQSYYRESLQHLDQVWAYFQEHKLLSYHNLYNVNIPANPRAFQITRQGDGFYSDDFGCVGENMYEPQGKCVYVDSGENVLDTDAVHHGLISISPLTLERTELSVYEKLLHLNAN